MTSDPVMEPYGPLLDSTVRIASWNTWSRFGPWEAREPVLLHHLRAAAPDIVSLQEAWATADDSQADRFASALDMRQVQAAGLEYLGVRSGQAVLSRWPIMQVESLRVRGRHRRRTARRCVGVRSLRRDGRPALLIRFAGRC